LRHFILQCQGVAGVPLVTLRPEVVIV